MIESDGLKKVSALLTVSPSTLASYLADLHLNTITLRGIEAGIAEARFDGAVRSERRQPSRRQTKLRAMIIADGITKVCEQLDIGRELLARYLADLALNPSSVRGIEASIDAAPFPVTAPRHAPKGGRVHALSR